MKNLDPHYEALWERTSSLDALEAAGWFDDGQWDGDEALDALTTPLTPLLDAPESEVALLYFPGCFAPLHDGHLHAMASAKEEVERATGLPVVLGLFAPEHPHYVDGKIGAPDWSPHDRVFGAQTRVEGSEWLRVDAYPALYANTALNFTRLLERLERYLLLHGDDKTVRPFLVFGSDNERFARALLPKVGSVCVPRPGFPVGTLPPETLLVRSEGVDESSTRRRNMGFTPLVSSRPERTFLLRDDLRAASSGTPLEGKEDEALRCLRELLQAHLPPGIHLRVVDAMKQVQRRFSSPTISLDPFYPGDYQLALSRPFELAAGQVRTPLALAARPGAPEIRDQLALIPPGDYVLVDDDYHTGTTLRLATELLSTAGIGVSEWVGLGNDGGPYFDVADARDFFPGLAHAGLVVRSRTGLRRVPYCLPEVNLAARISLPPANAWAFSQALRNYWHLLGLDETHGTY